jgi:hypothetical protein
MTALAFMCGKCRTVQAAPWGSRGRAGCCGGCGATVRVPELALEFEESNVVEYQAPSQTEAIGVSGESYVASGQSRPRKANSQVAFLMLLCLGPALVSSMAVNVYLALQLRAVASRHVNK